MVKTRYRGDPNDSSEDDFISLRHRPTRRHQINAPETNGFAGYEEPQHHEDSASTDYGTGLGTHSKAATAAISPRSRRTLRRNHQLRKAIVEVEEDDGNEGLMRQPSSRKKSSPKSPLMPISRPRTRTRTYAMAETTDDNTEEDLEEQPRMKYALSGSPSSSSKKCVTNEDGSIRRSTRQKKLLYCTFNQNLILKHQMLMGEEGGDEDEGEDDETSEDRKRKRSMEVEPTPEQDGLDMYSRVKRIRKKVNRDIYGVPVLTGEMQEGSGTTSGSTTEDQSGDEESEEEEHSKEGRTYHLRVHKPQTNLYKAPPIVAQKRATRGLFRGDTPPRRAFNSDTYRSPAHKSPRFRKRTRKRPAFHGSSSTSSSSGEESDDERQFERRKAKSMARNRNRCLPMNFTGEDVSAGIIRDRTKIGTSLADIDPMSVDKAVTFDSVGGLGKHILSLKEMIVFPLLYPEVFERFKITPPRGVLFYGPPGTGKTLVARALANECSNDTRKVAFFMRKGADCLSKWVGESERQLRLLFDQAYQMRPSIIFFDEIDGLAPVRSSRQDQIHSSIVSTLLALMDGLDNRGEIVIIGATNRLDSIDPALRRPGRFDREFLFPLPTVEARKQILQINTKAWNPRLCDRFLGELAEHCVGYCGADLKALCTEGALHALRRRYPQIYTSEDKLELDVSTIEVQARDFHKAMQAIVPASQRSVSSPGRALNCIIQPLLDNAFQKIIIKVQSIFPTALIMANTLDAPVQVDSTSQVELCSDDDDSDLRPIYEPSSQSGTKKNTPAGDVYSKPYLNFLQSATQTPLTYRPRLLLAGQSGQGQSTHLAPAILHHLERVPVHILNLPALHAVTAHTPEEACAQIFCEARRTSPSIVFMPHIGEWWNVVNVTLQATFMALLHDLEPSAPIMLIATCERQYSDLPRQIKSLFCADDVVVMKNPTETERRAFFEDLLLHQIKKPPSTRRVAASRLLEVLPKAKPVEVRKLTESELKMVHKQEEKHFRELRLFLRDILNKLGRDRKFVIFAKPVDTDDVPDYYEIIKNPMDLSTMMTKIDLHQYEDIKQFVDDINWICCNALEYNPNHDTTGRAIRHRACALRDTCQALIDTELDPEFEKICNEIKEARRRRGEQSTSTVPPFYFTKPSKTTTNISIPKPTRLARYRQQDDNDLNDHDSTPGNIKDGLPKIRTIVKKVRMFVANSNSKTTKKNKSPWCRTRKRRYFKKVIVYVDEFGNEVPPPNNDESKQDDEPKENEQVDGPKTEKALKVDGPRTRTRSRDRASDSFSDTRKQSISSDKQYNHMASVKGVQKLMATCKSMPKLKAVIKRVPINASSSTREKNKKKSPWCKPKPRRYRNVTVYIDEFGNEVAQSPEDVNKSYGAPKLDSDNDTEQTEVVVNKISKETDVCLKDGLEDKKSVEEKENKPIPNSPSPNIRSQLSMWPSGPSKAGTSPLPSDILMRSASPPHTASTHSVHLDAETPRRFSDRSLTRSSLCMEERPQRRSSRSNVHGLDESIAPKIVNGIESIASPSEAVPSPSNTDTLPTSNHCSQSSPSNAVPPPSPPPAQPCSSPSTSNMSPSKDEPVVTAANDSSATIQADVDEDISNENTSIRVTRSKSQVPAAVEAMAKRVLETVVPISVIIDDDALNCLLAKTVQMTENANVEYLERVYCRLSQMIFKHRDYVDKTLLLQDLDQLVSNIATNHHSST